MKTSCNIIQGNSTLKKKNSPFLPSDNFSRNTEMIQFQKNLWIHYHIGWLKEKKVISIHMENMVKIPRKLEIENLIT